MKHQITLVGGQLLPVYLGIKEFNPDLIHFIVSEESISKIGYLKKLLKDIDFAEELCNPFDHYSILTACQKVLNMVKPQDEILFNLTGGTKIMVLTAQSVIHEKGLVGFYINQNNTVLMLPTFKVKKLESYISIREFLEIGGHRISNLKTLKDYSEDDFHSIESISKFSDKYEKIHLQINSALRKKYDNQNLIPSSGELEIGKTILKWRAENLSITLNGVEVLSIHSPHFRNLFFRAGWWELIVAKAISNWTVPKEVILQCELPFKSDNKITKNEIDILINLGNKLIFIECKSGLVKQEDINKMRIVKDTYGGIISKSVLVAKYKPKPTILEKCKELNVEVFSHLDEYRRVNRLENLVTLLDKIQDKLAV